MSINSADLEILARKNDIFVCGICGEHYTKTKLAPITLNCGHTFCRGCIDHLGKNLSNYVPCGMCMVKTWTPSVKVVKNYQMLDVLKRYALLNDEPIRQEPNPAIAEDSRQQSLENEANESNDQTSNEIQTTPQPNNGDVQNENDEAIDVTVSTVTSTEGSEVAQVNDNSELDEDTEETFINIQESTGIINNGLDDLCRIAREIPSNRVRNFQDRIEALYNELDEIAYHPILTIIRRSLEVQQIANANQARAKAEQARNEIDVRLAEEIIRYYVRERNNEHVDENNGNNRSEESSVKTAEEIEDIDGAEPRQNESEAISMDATDREEGELVESSMDI